MGSLGRTLAPSLGSQRSSNSSDLEATRTDCSLRPHDVAGRGADQGSQRRVHLLLVPARQRHREQLASIYHLLYAPRSVPLARTDLGHCEHRSARIQQSGKPQTCLQRAFPPLLRFALLDPFIFRAFRRVPLGTATP